MLSAPPRLRIYQTLIDGEVAREQENFGGVPVLLLDYIVTTALLLVTDVQEYLDRPVGHVRIPGSSARIIQRWLAIIHDTPLPPDPEPKQPASPVRSPTDSQPEGSGSASELSPSVGIGKDRLSTFSSIVTESVGSVAPSISGATSPSASDYSSLPPRSAIPGLSHSPSSPFSYSPTPDESSASVPQISTNLTRKQSITALRELPLPGPQPQPHPFSAASLTRSMSNSSTTSVSAQRPATAPAQEPSNPAPPPPAPAPRVRRQLPIPPVPTPNCVPPPSLSSPTSHTPPVSFHTHSASFSYPHRSMSASAAIDGGSGSGSGSGPSRPSSPAQSATSSSASGSGSGSGSGRLHLVRRSLGHMRNVPPALPPPAGTVPLPPKLAQEYQHSRENPGGQDDVYQEVRSYTQPPLRVQNGTPGERSGFRYAPVPSSSAPYLPGQGLGQGGLQVQVPSSPGPSDAIAINPNANVQASGLVGQIEDLHLTLSHSPALSISPHQSFMFSPQSVVHPLASPRREMSMPADYRQPITDAGAVIELDERASVYDMPPPAYDAIDFNAPMPAVVVAPVPGPGHLRQPPRTLPSLPSQAQPLQR